MHRAALAASALLLLVAGCGEPALRPHLSDIQREVFDLSCTAASCHAAETRMGELNLEAGASHDQLVEVTANWPAAADAGMLRVVPGDPDTSFLMVKLRAPIDSDYGQLMPVGLPDGLDPEIVDAVAEWIRRGALDD